MIEPQEQSKIKLSKSSVKIISEKEREQAGKGKRKQPSLHVSVTTAEKRAYANEIKQPVNTKNSSIDLNSHEVKQPKNFSIIPTAAQNSIKKSKPQNLIRVQFYPGANSLEIDSEVDMGNQPSHEALVLGKTFNNPYLDGSKTEIQNTLQQSIKKVMRVNTPCKLLEQDLKHSSIRSFYLSPHSVKQSLPPGDSIEGGSLTFISYDQSLFSKMSGNQL